MHELMDAALHSVSTWVAERLPFVFELSGGIPGGRVGEGNVDTTIHVAVFNGRLREPMPTEYIAIRIGGFE